MSEDKDTCPVCELSEAEGEEGETWVECTKCLQWYHNACAGVTVIPEESEKWYCSTCQSQMQKLNDAPDSGTSNTSADHKPTESKDDRLQLQLMADLIKEKEALCALKQKQLDLMLRLGENVNEDAANLTNTKGPNIDANATENKSNSTNERRRTPKSEKKKTPVPERRDEVNNDLSNLMKKQMQLMSQQFLMDLPEFDGEVDMWPIFYAQFTSTTKQAGFSDAFNLIRLRKALKGEARQAVIGILAMPNCLQDVMRILEKRFGSNDVIVKHKLKKLMQFTPPNENKPQNIKQFYEFLLGLNATLKNANALNYLQSPQTLESIVDKLPVNMLRQWTRFKRSNVDLQTIDAFIEWFEPYYDCANEMDRETIKIVEPPKRNNSRVNVHNAPAEAPSSVPSVNSPQCSFCRKPQHTIDKCNNFKAIPVHSRWLFVRKRRLCFICLLGKHRSDNCDMKQKCNIQGCEDFHHQLLHRINNSIPSPNAAIHENNSNAELSAVSAAVNTSRTHFRSLPVTLFNPENGKSVLTWAFLDEGSSPTMMTDDLANLLELKGEHEECSNMDR